MRLSFHIAFRYFWAKKTTNAITIISWIALLAVAFGVAALVVVLSVFNGFESLVKTLYHSFNSDLQVSPLHGKVMMIDSITLQRINQIKGIETYSSVLEENALLRYRDKQFIATIQGVDSNFNKVNEIESYMYKGVYRMKDSVYGAVLGAGIAQALDLNPEITIEPLTVFTASKSASVNVLDPSDAFHQQHVFVSGVFAIQQDFDIKYAFIDLQLARELLEEPSGLSYINIKLKKGFTEADVMQPLQNLLGNGVTIKNRYRQNSFIYLIMQIEKWVVFAILAFILIIASFNFIGSLSMIAIDKRKDLSVLQTLGASPAMVKQIFLFIGLIMISLGALLGFAIGFAICIGQQHFEWLKLQGDSFVISAYPVDMHLLDFISIALILFVIGLVASWIPARRAAKEGLRFER